MSNSDRHADRQVFRARVHRGGLTPGGGRERFVRTNHDAVDVDLGRRFRGHDGIVVHPPIIRADASTLHAKTPVSFVGYWVIPFSLFGLGALATKVLPRNPDHRGGQRIVRKITIVAYGEATIDEGCTTWPRSTPIVRSAQARRLTTSKSEAWARRWWVMTADSHGPQRRKAC